MTKKTILLMLAILLLTSMACNITNLLGFGKDKPEEEPDEIVSDLAIALTEAAAENEANEDEQEEPVQQEEQQLPTNTPAPTNTPLPTAPPLPTDTPVPSNPGMITDKDYYTDFTFNDGWFDYYLTFVKNPEYDVEYPGNEAVITVDTKDTYVYLFQDDLYYDLGEAVYVEAAIEVADGPYNNNLGVVCRVTEDGWYEYLIRTNGYWDLYIYDTDDGYTHLDTGGSWDINMKHDENTIGMLCDGEEMTLYINGVEVKTVRNDEWDEGGVGLNVGTLEYGGSVFEVKSFTAVNDLSLVNLP